MTRRLILMTVPLAFLAFAACGNNVSNAERPAHMNDVEGEHGRHLQISLQSQFPPLIIKEAPAGGAHPIGGPALDFVRRANVSLEPLGAEIAFHLTGDMCTWDEGAVEPSIVAFPTDFPNLHEAVAAGADMGGVDMGIGLANMNGHPFGQLIVAGLPFGLEPDEFAAWLYAGGGLDLQQEIYDEKF